MTKDYYEEFIKKYDNDWENGKKYQNIKNYQKIL